MIEKTLFTSSQETIRLLPESVVQERDANGYPRTEQVLNDVDEWILTAVFLRISWTLSR